MEAKGGRLLVELKVDTVEHAGAAAYQELKPGNYLKLRVSDNGYGISPENISRIFDPYFTTKEKGKGSGMGLATVYGIVKDHGGHISVKSEVGSGTSFTLLFPLKVNETITEIETTKPLPRGNETILLVDDEDAIIDVGKELLENLGYLVEARVSSQDALEAFRAQHTKYDLVITDMAMPKMNGLQLTENILAINPNVPIILCTGFSQNLDTESASKVGIKRVLMKPITLNDLAKTVRSVLDDTSAAN
jgi:CheY-like chemotaxis protein